MSQCMYVSSHVQKQHVQISRNFLYMLPVAVSRSSSDDSAVRYVLLVLWMTPYFHIMVPMGRIKDNVVFRSLGGGTESEVAVCNCLVFIALLMWFISVI